MLKIFGIIFLAMLLSFVKSDGMTHVMLTSVSCSFTSLQKKKQRERDSDSANL